VFVYLILDSSETIKPIKLRLDMKILELLPQLKSAHNAKTRPASTFLNIFEKF